MSTTALRVGLLAGTAAGVVWMGRPVDAHACLCSPRVAMWPLDGATDVALDAQVLVWGAEDPSIEADGAPVPSVAMHHDDWQGGAYVQLETPLAPNTAYQVRDGAEVLGGFQTGDAATSSVPAPFDGEVVSLRESPISEPLAGCATSLEEVAFEVPEQGTLLEVSRPDGASMLIPSTELGWLGERTSEWCAISLGLDDVDGPYCLRVTTVGDNLERGATVEACADVEHCLAVGPLADEPSATCYSTRADRDGCAAGGAPGPVAAVALLILGAAGRRRRRAPR